MEYFIYYSCNNCKSELVLYHKKYDDISKVNHLIQKCNTCNKKLQFIGYSDIELELKETKYTIRMYDPRYGSKNKIISDVSNVLNESLATSKRIFEDEEDFIISGLNGSEVYHILEVIGDCCPYDIEPNYSLKRVLNFYYCPICDHETVHKKEILENSQFYCRLGIYCKHCDNWVLWGDYNKIDLDETIYKVISRGEHCVKPEQMTCICEYYGINETQAEEKLLTKNKVLLEGDAYKVKFLAEQLQGVGIQFNIEPEFPHELTLRNSDGMSV